MASGLPSTSVFFWAVRLHAEPSGFLYGHCLSCHLCGCSGSWAPLWAMLELPAPRLLRLLGSFNGHCSAAALGTLWVDCRERTQVDCQERTQVQKKTSLAVPPAEPRRAPQSPLQATAAVSKQSEHFALSEAILAQISFWATGGCCQGKLSPSY